MARHIANLMKLPFSMNDATALTQAGYVGADVDSCLQRLLHSADADVENAEIGGCEYLTFNCQASSSLTK